MQIVYLLPNELAILMRNHSPPYNSKETFAVIETPNIFHVQERAPNSISAPTPKLNHFTKHVSGDEIYLELDFSIYIINGV